VLAPPLLLDEKVRPVSTSETLSSRLRKALIDLGISQKEAATRCNLPEQTISNILTKNMDETKTAGRIAKGLGISLDWLVYGTGNPLSHAVKWLPILDNYYSLGLYLTQGVVKENTTYVATERDYGEKAFAWALPNGSLAICGKQNTENPDKSSFLLITDEVTEISDDMDENKKFMHKICEMRTYNK
jgi:transcriptional regulator with XRE-family HTH domain